MKPIKILHVANGRSQFNVDRPLAKELARRAELEVVEHGSELSDQEALTKMRGADVLLTMWGARPVPKELADDPGNVRYIMNVTGTCRAFIPIEIIRSDIPVTNWGDAPARVIAEGAVALYFTVLKDIRLRTEKVAAGQWGGPKRLGFVAGHTRGLKIGLYGCGAIGSRFVEMMRPFEPEFHVFDPYATGLPEGCEQVDSLDELFDVSEALVVWAGLTEETEKSVTAERLAKLPDHGIVINCARGGIIDQDALFAEVKAGRLRAGLDVLADGDHVPANHEARQWPNLVLTCHTINAGHWPQRPPQLGDAERNALDNLQRFLNGDELKFVMNEKRYLLST